MIPVVLSLSTACLLAVLTIRLAPPATRAPLIVYNAFYGLTTVIGAALITHEGIAALWKLSLPGLDAGWLAPGTTAEYWLVLFGPFVVVNATALLAARSLRRPAFAMARLMRVRPDLLTCWIVGTAFVAYCLVNLAVHGYLGATIVDPASAGLYRLNIRMRTDMARELGGFHFALLYMAIPSVCIVALHRSVRDGSAAWWALFLALSAALVALYMTTYTKATILIYGIAVITAASALRLVGPGGIALAAAGGLVALMLLEFVLSGAGALEILGALNNVIFRQASGFPFYVEIFPDQVPYVGIDLALGRFGIGMAAPPNLVVFEYMFPSETWVQGAAPAPAHVSALAQAGLWWSLATMAGVGVLCAFAGALRRFHRSPMAFSAYVGLCVTIYYATQTDAVGIFDHSYGYKWWLFGLLVMGVGQRALEVWFSGQRIAIRSGDRAAGQQPS